MHQGQTPDTAEVAQWNALLAQHASQHQQHWDINIALDGSVTDHIWKLTACYQHFEEDEVWLNMRKLQREFADLLTEQTCGFLRGALVDALHSLRYLRLHAELDTLYRKIFATTAVEMEAPTPMTDRLLARLKVAFLEQAIMETRIREGRAEQWCDIDF